MVRHLNIPLDDEVFLKLKALKSFFEMNGKKKMSWADYMMMTIEYSEAVGNGWIEEAIKEAKWIKPDVKEAYKRKLEIMLNGLQWMSN